jgi:dephospho-CoA kinase
VTVLTVALTGGIATGKSVVAGILAGHGCYVQSADLVAHRLIKPGRPAWKSIVGHFGPRILKPDGTINRRALGKIIFASRAERLFLNRVLHPLVMAKKREVVRRLERLGTHKIFVSEAALTIESGYAPFFDKIVVVHCPEKLQTERLMKRDGITEREAKKRIASQMGAAEKIKQADYLIDTSGPPSETAAQAENLYRNLLADFRTKRKQERRLRPSGGP